jgi:hypothetical protein
MIPRFEVTQEGIKRAVFAAKEIGIEPPYTLRIAVAGGFIPDGVLDYSRKLGVEQFVGPHLTGPYSQWYADPTAN